MSSLSGSIINQLLKVWPPGTVAVLPWLKQRGVYQQLAYRYEKSSWLKRIGEGAYIRDGDKVAWTGAVYALQTQLRLPVHVGGKTALELKGFGHFISVGGGGAAYLFSRPGTKLPKWFQNYKWDRSVVLKMPRLFSGGDNLAFSEMEFQGYTITLSAPERAIMEVLHLVPNEQGFEGARLLMEGLTTLRPTLVQNLLEKCLSIKIKRLFMYLAEECNHEWFKKLNPRKVSLGKGKRAIVKGGTFNAKYQITVPSDSTRKFEKENRP